MGKKEFSPPPKNAVKAGIESLEYLLVRRSADLAQNQEYLYLSRTFNLDLVRMRRDCIDRLTSKDYLGDKEQPKTWFKFPYYNTNRAHKETTFEEKILLIEGWIVEYPYLESDFNNLKKIETILNSENGQKNLQNLAELQLLEAYLKLKITSLERSLVELRSELKELKKK